jgi:ABC-type multidrug transport system ATPase subunit
MSQDEPQDQELTGEEISQLARKLFGPEEEWDDAAAEFVLRLYGITPDTEAENDYARKLLNSVIQRKGNAAKKSRSPF